MDFPCTKCGACCRRAHLVSSFILGDSVNGGCKMLAKDNTCEVYEKRPLVCNIKEMRNSISPDVSIDEYYKNNALICNIFIKADGMDSKYLIDMEALGNG